MTDLEQLVAQAPQEQLLRLIGQLASAQAQATARLVTPAPVKAETVDGTITVAEAARRLGVSKDYVYKGKFPFVAYIGRRVVCSARGVEKFRADRMGRAHGSR